MDKGKEMCPIEMDIEKEGKCALALLALTHRRKKDVRNYRLYRNK